MTAAVGQAATPTSAAAGTVRAGGDPVTAAVGEAAVPISGAAGTVQAAFAAALAGLPACGPKRLAALLAAWSPEEAWVAVREGRVLAAPAVAEELGRRGAGLAGLWRDAARATDPAHAWGALRAAGVDVHVLGRPGFPAALAADHEAPAVLFSRGSPAALDHPRVAIVGTRRCTHYGREVARGLGRDLAAAGVTVVSGLALGIDGAAHEGALAAAGGAPPVAVVGSGLDVVYPRANASLWSRVAGAGLVLSECPLGARPEAWRFPARNRILAALATVVVVVESRAAGGSLLTAAAAAERGIKVMAVPGSIRSPASLGTNRLLADGVAPVQDVDDILVGLELEGGWRDRRAAAGPGARLDLDPEEAAVMAAVDVGTAASTEEVLARTGFDLGRAAVLLNRLEMRGAITGNGGWWERC